MMKMKLTPWTAALLALPLLALSVMAAVKGPDSFGYQANDRATYSFADISGGSAASVLAGADDDQSTLNLGFTFKFYGTDYTTACVNSNGFLTFGNCNPALAVANFANQDLTAASPQGNLPTVAVYWTDLTFAISGSGAVYYQTSGTAGSRKFIVQWNQAYPQNGSSGITFQAILSEGSNQILMQYANTVVGSVAFDLGHSATVGIRDASGNTNGKNLQWSYNSTVIASQSAIVFLPASAQYQLTTTVTPAGAGTVTPSALVAAGSLQSVTAAPASGWKFTSWSGDAAGTSNPVSVLMSGPRYVVANFQKTAQPPQVTLTPGSHSDGAPGTRVVALTLTDAAGAGTATGTQILSITNITVLSGTGPVTVASALPVTVGNLAGGQSGAASVTFNWPATATRISLKFSWGANSGAYTNSTTLTMFR
jgi:hypothetical protein